MKKYKNNRILLVSCFAITVSTFFWTEAVYGGEDTSYYQNVYILKNQVIIGQKALTKTEITSVEHYYIFEYDDQGRRTKVQYYKDGELSKAAHLGVAQIVSLYDEEGGELRSFQNESGEPVPNARRVYSMRLELDEEGTPISTINYDQYGNLIKDKDGVVQYHMNTSDSGDLVGIKYLDKDGTRIVDRRGVGELTFEYDETGNEIERRFYNLISKLTEKRFLECAIIRNKYDGDNLIEKGCYGTDESLKLSRKWGQIAIIRYEYDTEGNKIKESFFGTNEALKIPKYRDRAAIIEYKYDAMGNILEKRFYGTDGELMTLRNGEAIRQWLYDEVGRNVEASFYGADEELKALPTGEAIRRWKYDTQGYVIEKSFHGIDGEFINTARDEVSLVRYNYDSQGNKIEEAFFNTENNPALSKQWKVAIRRWEYDTQGNKIEMSSYGTDGQLMLDVNLGGAAIQRFEYDEDGKKIRTILLGVDEKVITEY